MHRRDKMVLWAAIVLTLGLGGYELGRIGSIQTITGVVLRDDLRPENQLTIPGVDIISDDLDDGVGKSDARGVFTFKLRRAIHNGDLLTLHFRHPDYRPLDTTIAAGDRLNVIRMHPASAPPAPVGPSIIISDIRIRYSVKSQTTENVGSVAKVFEVKNTGNVPCGSGTVCSPDGKWKAAIDGVSLDAGENSEFQHVRVSCIAGPCPFTAIEKDSFSQGGQKISASVRDWSDTVSFVLEAEVMRTLITGAILHSYPIIFNRTASFTVPPNAEGSSIEASLDHEEIVYPIGPKAKLSWADCDVQTGKDLTKLYRCSLKPGYQFK
jgi:hypothetical protein